MTVGELSIYGPEIICLYIKIFIFKEMYFNYVTSWQEINTSQNF